VLLLFFNKYIGKMGKLKWCAAIISFLDKLYPEYTAIGTGFVETAIDFLMPGGFGWALFLPLWAPFFYWQIKSPRSSRS